MNLPYGYDVNGKANKANPKETIDNIKKHCIEESEFSSLKYKVKEDTINAMKDKKYRAFKLSKLDLGPIIMVLVCVVAVFIFISIDKYLEQKHIDSGTPYIRGVTPNGYLIEQIKLKDGTTWDILCIDGVKTIYDIDKRLVSETNLACF